MSIKVTSKEMVQELLDNYDNFLFDCDGVIWLDTTLLPKVLETLDMLRALGKRLIFVTNNSTKTRDEFVAKFASFGLKINREDVFGSSYASAIFAKDILKLPQDQKIWIVGDKGLEKEFKEAGYKTIGGTKMPELDEPLDLKNKDDPIYHLDPQVGAAVVGMDTKINYHRLAVTLQYLLKPNVVYIATNIDSTYPANGMVLPGEGTLVQAAAYCSQKKPYSCGKPSKSLIDVIVKTHGIDKNRSIMIGDNLNTDMKFGLDNGLETMLVMTGIGSEEALNALEETKQPTYFADKLGDLYELMESR
ncbi:hypothetical protein FOA43_001340 [Brettanomyces nanus]|uniref:4-nitrophenylphosphatase n=1 Tax=Eeniella nana TaxID=13502 RepID=A0A875RX67_EENNA|nr:uncharacterized protein FOA43_001340 [Brettanomyces nanus]QPG74021.1 hypothetical protein FOA43_001340 [Brettanomyces nanus]